MAQDYFDEFGSNAGYVAELEALYHAHEAGVPQSWRKVFGPNGSGIDGQGINGQGKNADSNGNGSSAVDTRTFEAQQVAEELLSGFRKYASLLAKINPLESSNRSSVGQPELEKLIADSKNYSAEEVIVSFAGAALHTTVGELLTLLRDRYAGTVSVDFDYIRSQEIYQWVAQQIEAGASARSLEEKTRSYRSIVQGEVFDSELHTNFLGAKRFSLAGADASSAMLEDLLYSCADKGIDDVVLGMAHRGRLSTLAFFAGKPLAEIAGEFKDQTQATAVGGGDVKYHMGYTSQKTINGKTISCSIPPNPSHLEFVNPVAHGIVRAKQEERGEVSSVLPVLLHGDASFAGQGIVCEVLAYAALPGYQVGGTVHLILNNQVGFTTDYREGHSGAFCSDMARGYDIPVIHVNGEDIEACIFATRLALDYRQKFAKDIVIDLICYRRFGHNEGDDPTFTQPVMYKEISQRTSVATRYAESLSATGTSSPDALKEVKDSVTAEVKAALQASAKIAAIGEKASGCCPPIKFDSMPTITEATLKEIATTLVTYPESFKPHPKLATILKKRSDNITVKNGVDWGLAEALAFSTVMQAGIGIRLSGQDSGRGTFSHRHAELHDTETGECVYPIRQIAEKSGVQFNVINSFLSENAVLGYEFGYGVQANKKLVFWEAQFGDFCNGAQPIIDQFIVSAEAKWGQRSNVALLLPHGFEGQGPEHSSARLERFLQMAAQQNMRVVQPSNAGQYYHLIRSQAYLSVKKPLVVLTPKSLLRAPDASCSLEDLTGQNFREIITERPKGKKKDATLVACSGKVYYELKKWISEHKLSLDSVAVVRVEQLYPYPSSALESELAGLTFKQVVWVQDEPENMGAYRYISPLLESQFEAPVGFVGRASSATPATGSPSFHYKEVQMMGEQLKEFLK